MVKHSQTIRRQFADELFGCIFHHFGGLVLKGLKTIALPDKKFIYRIQTAVGVFRDISPYR